MSASRIFSRMAGHPSPSPASVVTPNRTSCSTTRTSSPLAPFVFSASRICRPSSSELDGAGERERVQTSTIERSVVVTPLLYPRSWPLMLPEGDSYQQEVDLLGPVLGRRE